MTRIITISYTPDKSANFRWTIEQRIVEDWLADAWMTKVHCPYFYVIDFARLGEEKLCYYCDEEVRGLKNAPEIPVHKLSGSRICKDGMSLADWK